MTPLLFAAAAVGGLILLYFGGDKFVAGATRIAVSFKISQIVVGLVIVAFATSAPELVVGIDAAVTDHTNLAIGNVIGSNIANLFLILGICAIIRPIPIKTNVLRFDKPIMIGSTLLLFIFLLDKVVARWQGVVFIAGLISYIAINLRYGSKQEAEIRVPEIAAHPEVSGKKYFLIAILMLVFGLAGLVLGARLLVFGASNIARFWGVSESLIGLSIVAFGTSLPELATGMVAAIRKQTDLVIGNMVGSNIFNILGILGIAAIIRPLNGEQILMTDLYFMIATSVLLLPIMITKRRLGRIAGIFMLVSYCAYIGYRYIAS